MDVHRHTLNSPQLDPVFRELKAVCILWYLSDLFYLMVQSVDKMYSSEDGGWIMSVKHFWNMLRIGNISR
jgi:hypothetical protein